MSLKKRTQLMLLRRGIKLEKYHRRTVTNTTQVCGFYDSFTKKDLRDDGYYELVETLEYGEGSVELCHKVSELETDEQFARRLCREHDSRK